MRLAVLLAFAVVAGAFTWLAPPDALERIAGLAAHVAGERDRGDSPPSPHPGSVDPTPYRDAIESIEAVLYREAPASWSDLETLSALAMQLGERLYADLGPLRGRRALTALVDLASSVGAQAESGFAAPELDGPRAAWEALRAEWFLPAPWLGRTTARLVAAQRPPLPVASLLDLHELWKWAGAIETLLDGDRSALERAAEAGAGAPDDVEAERDLADRWQALARDWDERVRGLGALAPRRPAPGGEQNLVFAHQALEQALHQLALATAADGESPLPSKAWRAQCLDAAAEHVAAARRFLAQAHTGAPSTQTASARAAMP